jgi:hypothetical protein
MIRDKFEVNRIRTTAITANVIDLEIGWNLAVDPLVHDPVNELVLRLPPDASIAISDLALPLPA